MTEYTLGEICELKTGVSFKKIDYVEKGTPVLRDGNIQKGIVTIRKGNNQFYCDPKSFSQFTLVKPNDIVISTRGSAGKVGINLTNLEFVHSNNVSKCIPLRKELVDHCFLYHWLRNSEKHLKT